MQTIMNDIEHKDWALYDINEKYYLDAIERELDNFHKMHNGSHPPVRDRD